MAILRPSRADISESIWSKVIANTNYSGSRTEGVIPALVEAMSDELDKWYKTLETVDSQASVFTAYGPGLERLGANLGVPRRSAQAASTFGSAKSIRFSNLGASQVTISSGTRIWRKDTPQLVFFTTESIVLDPGQTGYTHARADATGESYNVPVNYFDKHSAPVGAVLITNVLPVSNGSNYESDDSYRERLIRAFQSRYTFNEETCIATLRAVPGVQDVLVQSGARGGSTFDAIVVPYNYSDLADVVTTAQAVLNSVTPIGFNGRVLAPIFRTIDVWVTLTFQGQDSNREALRTQIRDSMVSYIDSLPLGDTTGSSVIYLEQLKGIVNSIDRSITSGIVNIRVDNGTLVSSGSIPAAYGEKFVTGLIIVN